MNKAYPGLGSAFLLLALGLGAQYALALLWILVLGQPGGDFALMTGVVNLAALTALAAFGFWRSGEPPPFRKAQGVLWPYWVGLVLSAAGGTVVLGEISNAVSWFLPLPGWLARVFDQLSGGSPVVALFTLAVIAPVTEETLFRGLLLRGFARRYGAGPAILLSSALFALFHLNIWQALTAFLAGLYLGWVFVSTRSLWPSMLVHAVFNGLPVFLAALGFFVTGYNTPPDSSAVFQPPLWTLTGFMVLAVGLGLTKKWTPLFPDGVSDTVEP